MLWEAARAGMLDELQKMGEVSLAGFSPQSILARGQPAPPMETAALSKAFEILNRYEQMPKEAHVVPELSGFERLSKKSKKTGKGERELNQTKSFGAHTIGGMGAGKILGDFALGPRAASSVKVRKVGWRGAAIGGGLGLAEYGRKSVRDRIRAKQEAAAHPKAMKKHAALIRGVSSPSWALRAGRSTKSFVPRKGPSLTTVASGSSIGRKGRIPLR